MPTGFQLGPFYIHFYGIIIMLGVLAAAFVAERETKRRGMNPDYIWDMLPWLLIGGIIGARLWHVFTPTPSNTAQGLTVQWYLTHPLEIVQIWKGGLGIPGAVIGGVIALYIYSRRKNLSIWTWMDIIAPGLALAQAIGRWGNFVNQEIYGAPTDLPWAITIDPQYRLPGYENVSRYHPLFLYESLYNLANMAALLWIGRKYGKRLKPGDIFLVYLVIYPLGRFLLEFLRLDSAQVAGINFNQTMMAVIAVAAAVTLWFRHRAGAQPDRETLVEPVVTPEDAPAVETVVEPASQDDAPDAREAS